VIVGGAVVVQLGLPGIVVPTYRVRRYRPAAGTGRRVHPRVPWVLPFAAEQGGGDRAYRGDVKRVAIWVVCLVGGTFLGYCAGRLHALTVPDCTGVCPMIYPPFEVMQRRMIITKWTIAGFALGLSLAVVLYLWALHRASRSTSRTP
jgi:hypothetical protein